MTARLLWKGFRLLQEIHDDVPVTYIYSDAESYELLARINGTEDPDIFWFHCQPNCTPERMTDREGHIRWEGQNSAWGKLLHESIPQETAMRRTCVCRGNTWIVRPGCTTICSVITTRIAPGSPGRTR
ncbi:RHS repeat protein [Grimontella sp. AG753]|nr:RHS repeat protein [Grimontella sp. AG753]